MTALSNSFILSESPEGVRIRSDDLVVDLSTIQSLWPELILLLLATWIYVGGTLFDHRKGWTLLAVAAYLSAGCVIYFREASFWGQPDSLAFVTGPIVSDYLGYAARWLAIGFGVLMTLMVSRSAPRRLVTETLGTLMLLVVGMMVVARANDLVLLLVGLEMVSIPTYVLLYLGRRELQTGEATVKYFFLSLLASAMFLYGVSFLYGLTGSTSLDVAAVGGGETQALASVALILLLAGIGFKLAAVPFHFYAPDVYQGATNVNAALLSVAPKVAGVLAFVRVLVVGFPQAADLGWQIVVVLAIVTMTLGNVCAIRQGNFRRMMAYSSIAHAGYLLIGLSVALAGAGSPQGQAGLSATFLYLGLYVVGSLGAFAVVAALSDTRGELSRIDGLAGLGYSKPLEAAVLAVCMFSLAGIPPLGGFWGKLTLFTSALQAAGDSGRPGVGFWFTLLALVGAINAAIAATYYLRVVATMYFFPATATTPAAVPSPAYPERAWGTSTVLLVCGLLVLLLGVAPRVALQAAQSSAQGLRSRAVPLEPAVNDVSQLPSFEQRPQASQ